MWGKSDLVNINLFAWLVCELQVIEAEASDELTKVGREDRSTGEDGSTGVLSGENSAQSAFAQLTDVDDASLTDVDDSYEDGFTGEDRSTGVLGGENSAQSAFAQLTDVDDASLTDVDDSYEDGLTGEDRSTGVLGGENSAQSAFAQLTDVDDSYIVLSDFYIRNQKLYLKSAAKSPFAEWKTSVHLLCTSFFKILSNEIYYKASVKLRLRAIACTVAVPTVALMGILMPFASHYFNRIVGDLDCWMNGFNNNDIARLSSSDRQTRSSRCFAIDLQPYGFIGQNPNDSGNIDICSLDPGSCVTMLVDDIRRTYLDGGEIVVWDRNCITKA